MTKEELLQTYFYIEDISGSANTVTIQKQDSTAPTLNLEYSTDGSTWTTQTMNSDTTANTFELPVNGKLYLRGVNRGWCDSRGGVSYSNKITCSGEHNVGGNIMSLLYGSEFIGKTTFPTTNWNVFKTLFYQNIKLINAKDLQLPATTLANRCYYEMFNTCNKLISAPELPATTLVDSCYYGMFSGCSSLTTAPELPATTLASSCYNRMFQYCTGLTTAPVLLATTLTSSCYYQMFYNCSKLNYIKADFINYSNTNNEFKSWVSGVSTTGTFITNIDATYNPDNYRGVDGIPTGWNVPTHNYFKITDVSGEDNVLTITKSNVNSPEISLEYSYDNNSWNTVTFTELVCNINLPANGVIYLRGNNDSLATSVENYHSITCSGKYTISDNIVSLLNSKHFLTITELSNGFEFTNLFKDSTTLVDINKLELLPTTLTQSCYEGMFNSCTQLTASPILPATTLAISCYESMFYGCSNLNKITVNLIPYTNTNNEFSNWVNGVSEEGTLYLLKDVSYDIETIRGVNGVPEDWNIIKVIPFYIEDISGSANTVTIKKYNSSAPTLTIEYSTDGITWTTQTMQSGTAANTFIISANGKIYFRGVNDGWCDSNNTGNYNTITCSGQHNVGGNIMSLLYGSEFVGQTTFPTTNRNVFVYLFYKNTTLVNAKDLQLPATTLVDSCYQYMFYKCTSLTTAPELPATTLTNQCYESMFRSCSSLTTAPSILPATTLTNNCYYRMFYDCTRLTTAPELPATTLTVQCYESMFYNCTSLTTAPELPATILESRCYYSMFHNCTSLTTAPELPATTLAISCYYDMFYGCSSLNYIKADFIKHNSNYLTGWVSGVSSTGTFVMNPDATYNPENIRGVNGIPTGWNVPTYNYFKITDVSESVNILTITKSSAEAPEISLEYSYDSKSWNTVTFTELVCNIDLPANGVIYLRGNNDSLATSVENYHSITCSGNYTISDNIVSLLNSKDFIFITELTNGFEFTNLFKDSTTLVDINKLELLPTTLSTSCYESMFSGCTQLTASPILPASTLATSCYEGMFSGCSNLNEITVNLTPYTNTNNEFSNWVNGVSEKGTLYLTININYDIESIRGVNGVPKGWDVVEPNYFYIEDISGSANTVTIKKTYSSAPTLNLEYSTDGITWTTQTMQSGTAANTFIISANGKLYLRGVNNGWCNSIDEYNHRYNNITCSGQHNVGGNIMSLLYGSEFIGKTSFPTTNNSVLNSLFYYNTNLVNAQDLLLPTTTLTNNCYGNMFTGCTSLTTAPELPATTLASYCYYNMFAGCSSLTTAPELPATTLTNVCYAYMFAECSKLNYIKADFINYSNNNNEFESWVYGVSSTGTFIMNQDATYNPDNIRGTSGIPSNWVVCKSNERVINVINNNDILGTVTGSGIYAIGETVTLTAVPTYKGKFVSWSDGNTELTRTIEITEDLPYLFEYEHTAIFEEAPGIYFINESENINILTVTNTDKVLQYSTDNITWTDIVEGTTTIEFNNNVTIKGTNTSLDGVNFKNNELTLIEGNIMTLLHGDEITTIGNVFPEGSVNTFKGLFKDNVNLVDISKLELPETTVEGCYFEMFQGCSKLGSTSTIENPLLKTYFYIEDISGSENTVYIVKRSVDSPTLNLEYSTDGITWTTQTMNSDNTPNTFTIPGNGRIYFRGVNDGWCTPDYYTDNSITCSGEHNIGGNIMSLLYGSEFIGKTTFPNNSVFQGLFYDNDTLVNAQDLILPATTLTDFCYYSMFEYCTNLTKAPELPATTLAHSCYTNMFRECYSLQNVKIGYKGQLDSEYCTSMFLYVDGNGTLEIPSDVQYEPYDIAPSNWNVVINNNIGNYQTIITYNGLSTLSATELAPNCYSSMFQGCSSLEKATELPATELAPNCYSSMFQGCSKLNLINASFINYSNNNNEFTNWVDGVAAEGTFKYNKNATFNPEDIRGVNGIPEGWLVKNNSIEYFYIEDISGQQNMIGITLDNVTMDFFAPQPTSDETTSDNPLDSYNHLNVEYSYDGIEWQSLNILEECMNNNNPVAVISLEPNTKVYLRGINRGWNSFINNLEFFEQQFGISYEDMINEGYFMPMSWANDLPCPINTILCMNKVKIGGNILSLKYGEEIPSEVTSEELEYSFMNLFNPDIIMGVYQPGPDVEHNVNPIVDASELILPDVVGSDCYNRMFYCCSLLNQAPQLPAMELAPYCYREMFDDCTSLVKAPELPATTLSEGCYFGMFKGCSKLNYVKMGYKGYIEYVEEYSLKSVTPVTVSEELPSVDFSAVNSMLEYVSETGTFVMAEGAQYDPYEFVPYTWLIKSIDYGVEILALDDDLTLTISKKGNILNPISLRYSVDFRNWEYITEADLPYHIDTNYGIVLAGDNVSLEGIHIKGNSPYSMKGNIMCLLLGESGKEQGCTFPEGTTNNFKNLFLGDNFIEDISGLVFTETTVDNCYQHMFTGCTGITTLPQLTATNLSDSCYHGMFMGCDGLTKVVLPEAYLAPYAYSNMFLGCDNLSKVTVTYKEDVDKTNYKGWLNGVSVNGKFTYNHTEEVDSSIITSNYYVPSNWSVNYNDPNAINYFYIEDISGSDTQIGIPTDNLTAEGNAIGILEQLEILNLEYSYDTVEWNTVELNFDNGITWIDLPANSKVYLRGNNKSWNSAIRNVDFLQEIGDSTYEDIVDNSWFGRQNIITLSECNVGGDILTLMYGEEIPDTIESKDLDCAFVNLFGSYEHWDDNWYDSYVVDASKLILPDVVGIETYSGMFYECTSLTTAPELPATTLAEGCYSYMFYDCSSLTEIYAPNISTWDWNACEEWVDNVADDGIMHFNTRALFDSIGGDGNTGWSSIPSEWTAHIIETGEYIKTGGPS